MLESLGSNQFEYQKLSPEEQKSRGILGRLVGIIADFKRPTRNGRKYSEQLWEKVFSNDIMKEKIANRCCFGELGHPQGRSEIDLEKVAICLAEVPKKRSDGCLYGVFDILDTPCGKILKSLCDYGCNIGVSSRGEGDLITSYDGQDEVDPNTYDCECWDVAAIPAVEKARMSYVTESLSKTPKTLKQALQESLNASSVDDQRVMKEALKDLDIDLYDDVDTILVSKDEAWEKCDDLGNQFIDHFDNLYNSIDEGTSQDPVDLMQADLNTIRSLVFKDSNRKLTSDQIVDKFLFVDDSEDNIFDDAAECSAYCDFVDELTKSWNVKKALESTLVKLNTVDESRDINEDYYDGYKNIISKINNAKTVSELINISNNDVNNSIYAQDAMKGIDDSNNYISLQQSILTKLKELQDNPDINDESLNINEGAKSLAVDNNEAELLEQLQESLQNEQSLRSTILELQSKLSVSYAKETSATDELNKYKKAVTNLSEGLNKSKGLQERLNTASKQIKLLSSENSKYENQVAQLNEKLKAVSTEHRKLSENYSAVECNTDSLRESVDNLQKELSQVKARADKKEADLTSQMNSLKEKFNSTTHDYDQQLQQTQKLAEKYKSIAEKAVGKYISSKATQLGISENEIRNRLSENYTFTEIDDVCDELRQYKLNVSKLPFSSTSIKNKINENTRIKSTLSTTDSILPANTSIDDDVDEQLKNLAGLI